MLEDSTLVINTGPLLALIAATGDLTILKNMYKRVLVPFEVCSEINSGGKLGFGIEPFEKAVWLKKWSSEMH